jgi:hypothetical protein
METIIVAIIVLVAAVYALRSLLKMGKGGSACGGCKKGCQTGTTCGSEPDKPGDQ